MTNNVDSTIQQQTDLDRRLAKPMFTLTMIWLAIAGAAMHIAGAAMNMEEGQRPEYLGLAAYSGILLLVFWIAFWAEAFLHWRVDRVFRRHDFLICLFPFLRLGGRDHVNGESVWIPLMGWRRASDNLAELLERRHSYLMIAIALLVLPLLVFEYIFEAAIRENFALGMAVQFSQAFIWFAFAAEFILLISLVSKKFKYAKEHWLDLLIICLPMIAFMRLFRLTGAARLSRLTKSAKIFRLRGTAMRAWRAILILEIVDRILHRDDEKRIKQLKAEIKEKQTEIAQLEQQIEKIQQRIEEREKSAADVEQDAALS